MEQWDMAGPSMEWRSDRRGDPPETNDCPWIEKGVNRVEANGRGTQLLVKNKSRVRKRVGFNDWLDKEKTRKQPSKGGDG